MKQRLKRILREAIKLDIEKGDVILTGRYKNKRSIVKDIGTDEYGQPTINGKSILKFKIEKQMPKTQWSAKSRKELEESKMSMKILRETIRRLILEVKPLDAQDHEEQKRRGITSDDDNRTNAKEQRRVYGLQSEEEQEEDRTIMQMYHKQLHSSEEGKQLIKQFQTGQGVTVWHSIGYDSVASKAGAKSRDKITGSTPGQSGGSGHGVMMKWYKKFGSGVQKDQISTCATSSNIGDPIPSDAFDADNGGVVLRGVGFILRGYPAIVSVYDQMTQTLGSLSQSLLKHQKSSGVAKRSGSLDGMIVAPDFGFAGETVMDNWKTVGAYLNLGALDPDGDLGKNGGNTRDFIKVVWDALQTGLPVHIYDGTKFIGTFQGAKEEHIDKLFGLVQSYYRKARGGQTRSAEAMEQMDADSDAFMKDFKTPKVYLDVHPEAGKKEQQASKTGEGPPKPADPHKNPWYLYTMQKKAQDAGEWEPDPANDWGDPANPDLPCTVDPSFESWGDLYDSYFPGWRNWK